MTAGGIGPFSHSIAPTTQGASDERKSCVQASPGEQPLPRAKLCDMAGEERPAGSRYDWFGWHVGATPTELAAARLTETHEYFHRQLDDTTAFGGLTTTIASLAEAQPEMGWAGIRDRLQDMSDLVHESYAVGLSLLTTQRRLEPIPGYPTYDRHVRTVLRLLGDDVHPWVALGALRAAATACMQSRALEEACGQGIDRFDPASLRPLERPNQRLAALLAGPYASRVADAQRDAVVEYGQESWWAPLNGVLLRPEAVDGEAVDGFEAFHRRLGAEAEAILSSAGGQSVGPDAHHDDLRTLLRQAFALAPAGLNRIGAMVEARGGELLHGGALDSQTIELTAAPERAVVLPYGSLSGLSGEGKWRHGFLAVTRPQRIRAAHRLEGVDLPQTESVACLRSIVYEGEEPDSVLLLPLEHPGDLEEEVPIFVSVLSSAAAADPEGTAAWIRWADPDRVSLVMDTPLTAALRRWCSDGGRFRHQTRLIQVKDMEVRVIAGRIEQEGRRSPLVVVPTTEFGARWFEAVREEFSDLAAIVQEDPQFFEEQEDHLDIVLNHVMFEERYIGTGSWRREQRQ